MVGREFSLRISRNYFCNFRPFFLRIFSDPKSPYGTSTTILEDSIVGVRPSLRVGVARCRRCRRCRRCPIPGRGSSQSGTPATLAPHSSRRRLRGLHARIKSLYPRGHLIVMQSYNYFALKMFQEKHDMFQKKTCISPYYSRFAFFCSLALHSNH